MSALYADQPDLPHRFNLAMLQYRWVGEQGLPKGGYPILHQNRPFAMPWLWASEEGRALRRMGEGVFRIARSNGHRDLFSEVECYGHDWPRFSCADGQEREMSAPDLTRIMLGGVQYRRSIPSGRDRDREGED